MSTRGILLVIIPDYDVIIEDATICKRGNALQEIMN
jgi:hypothetical protein